MLKRRVPWFGLFGRQVFRHITLHVLLALLAGLTLFIAIDFVETGNLAGSATAFDLLLLQLINLPLVVQQIAILCVLIGSMTAVSTLSRRGEVVAILSAGAPPTVLLRPGLIAGVLFALLYAGLTEWIIPPARAAVSAKRRELGLSVKNVERRGRAWFRGKDRIYRVTDLEDPEGRVLAGVLMLRLEGGTLRERWDVDRLVFQEQRWIGEGIESRVFLDPQKSEGGSKMITRFQRSAVIDLKETPEDFVRSVGTPNRLPYARLIASTRARERLGLPAVGHRLELYRRHVAPLTLLLALALSIAVSLRSGRRPSLALALGLGSALGFSLWLLEEIGHALGTTSALPPFPAAHLGLFLVLVLGVLLWRNPIRPR